MILMMCWQNMEVSNMVFETIIGTLTTKDAVEAEIKRAETSKRVLLKQRDTEIDQIKTNYVGAVSKVDTYISELEIKLEDFDDTTLENVDVKFPTSSIVKA